MKIAETDGINLNQFAFKVMKYEGEKMSRARKRQVLFAVTMSLYMSTIMSGVVTWVNTGFSDGYFLRWLFAFMVSWSIALPLSLFGASRILRWTYKMLPDRE